MFADLSGVVIEGSCGLGRRLERQDEGSIIEFKKLKLLINFIYRL